MARERRHELLAMFTVIMSSAEYGAEEFGPYDSATAAALAIERLTASAALLNDGIARQFTIEPA